MLGLRWLWARVLGLFMWAPPRPYAEDEPFVRRAPGGEVYGQWGDPAPGALLVLLLHGNAGDVAGIAPLAEYLVESLGAVVVAPEYAGYGPDGGGPGVDETLRRCHAVFRHVTAGWPGRTMLLGISLGTGVAMELQRSPDVHVDRILLVAPFLSPLSVASARIARAFPWLDVLRSWEAAPDVRAPVLVVHGTEDRVIPAWHGDALAALVPFALRRDVVRVEGAGHNDVLARWPEFGERVRRFAHALEFGPPPGQ